MLDAFQDEVVEGCLVFRKMAFLCVNKSGFNPNLNQFNTPEESIPNFLKNELKLVNKHLKKFFKRTQEIS